jgi:hypothetical protein
MKNSEEPEEVLVAEEAEVVEDLDDGLGDEFGDELDDELGDEFDEESDDELFEE